MRYLEKHVVSDLKRKMVFIGGPRQVGKTTLAQSVMNRYFQNGRYLNWDFDEIRIAHQAEGFDWMSVN